MNNTFKRQIIFVMLMLLGCFYAKADDGLITQQITVNVSKAGTLSQKVSDSDKYKITNLKLTGVLDASDILLIRDMAGCYNKDKILSDGHLEYIDLSDVKFVGEEQKITTYDSFGRTSNASFKDEVIGEWLFSYLSALKSMILPANVTTIGNFAFYECTNLGEIDIPNSVTTIGKSAFYRCTSLGEATIPNSVTTIGDNAFYNCTSLTKVNIPESVTTIGSYAFKKCTSLAKVNIPNSVTTISGGAFSYCTSLAEVNIPNGVTYIGQSAFSSCTSLAEVNIPNGVTYIGQSAFSSCTSLAEVNIPNGVTYIEAGAFSSCTSLAKVSIPNGVTSIGQSAFKNCTSLAEMNLPQSIETIQNYAFENCSSLTYINIPNGVTWIGEYVFKDCTSLTKVNIPNGITHFGIGVFSNCSSLESVDFPEVVGGDYGVCIFEECSNLTSVRWSSSVIPPGTFYNCKKLVSVQMSSDVSGIYPYAFMGCENMTTLELPSSIKLVGVGFVNGCNRLKKLICRPDTAPQKTVFPQAFYKNFLIYINETDTVHLTNTELYSQIELVTPVNAKGYDEWEWYNFTNRSTFMAEPAIITDANPHINTGTYAEGTLSYSRSDLQPSTYATFCLPFSTDISANNTFDAVYTTNGTALYKPDGKLVLMLKKVDDAIIPAGQAFVAKLGIRTTSVTLSNAATLVADESTLQNPSPTRLEVYNWDGKSGLLTENADINVSYGGAFSTMTGLGCEYETFNSNGTFGPTENGTVKAFRAYVVKGDAATVSKVRSISFGLEDETTGISIITSSPVTDNVNAIYSIDGRLVSASGSTSGLPSGIYIMNHKKIIVK